VADDFTVDKREKLPALSRIKAIIIDLDGTLLSDENEISEKNLQALQFIKEQGIPLIIATARPPRLVKSYKNLLNKIDYLLCFNGLLSYKVGNNTLSLIQQSTPLSLEFITKVQNRLEKEGNIATLTYETEEDWLAEKSFRPGVLKDYPGADNELPQITKRSIIMKSNIYKVMFKTSSLNFWRQKYPEYYIDYLHNSPVLEALPGEMDKAAAVKELLQKQEISWHNIIAFGDASNDLTIIREADFGIAMKNATAKLKEEAFLVTDTNDNSGVAQVIEYYY